MRLIDADALRARMYHDAFEADSDMQKWDSGCWIRYKMFENAIEDAPTIKPERKKKCVWCDSPFRIEYYWIDREGNTASFQDEDCHLVATGIAKYCPNCGRFMRGEQE